MPKVSVKPCTPWSGTKLRGRAGHFGVVGTYERATRIRGELTILSSNTGTLVERIVPETVTFSEAGAPSRNGEDQAASETWAVDVRPIGREDIIQLKFSQSCVARTACKDSLLRIARSERIFSRHPLRLVPIRAGGGRHYKTKKEFTMSTSER